MNDNKMSKKNIFIIDNDIELGKFYTHLINKSTSNFFVEGYFDSYESAMESIKVLKPDIVLIDTRTMGSGWIDGIKIIKRNSPRTEILIISIHEDNDQFYQAIVSGASGHISKISNQFEILKRLEEIRNGEAAMSSKMARIIKKDIELNQLTSALSEIELCIINKLSEGKTYTQIAEDLETSKENIKTSIKNIYRALSLHNNPSDSLY